jgi:hypothetical protein
MSKQDKEKEPTIVIHEDISCHQLADVIRVDQGEVDQWPASNFHSSMLATDFRPYGSSCEIEKTYYHQPSKFCHLFYDPIGEYMELHFFLVLKPPNIILPSALGGTLNTVTKMLSPFHYPLISDRINKSSVRRLFEWLWWKYAFT